jgi:hypothetical protein
MLLKNRGEQGKVPVMRAIPWVERVIAAGGREAISELDKMEGHTPDGGRWFKVRNFFHRRGSCSCRLTLGHGCPSEPQPVGVRAEGPRSQVHFRHAQPEGLHGLHVPPCSLQGKPGGGRENAVH